MNDVSTSKQPEIGNRRELAELFLLRDRLKEDGEELLLKKIQICQEPIKLKCLSCGHVREARQRCKRRWCPCCAKSMAAVRADMLEFLVEQMQWPLFVTLTMRHDSLPCREDLRHLWRSFGKFRRRKLWLSRTKGGAACAEVTNQDGGWHPHLHSVIDCAWLAWKTPRPGPRSSPKVWEERCTAASKEVGDTWAKQLGQPAASCKIKRAFKATIAKEVAKYTVKNEDLVAGVHPPGDIIRALDGTRMIKTFGVCHGQQSRDILAQAKAYAKAKRALWVEECGKPECCPNHDLMPVSAHEWTTEDWDRWRQTTKLSKRTQIRCLAA